MGQIADNLARLRDGIAGACRRAGRAESEVALMAVSKVHPASAIREAYEAGQRLFGENRVQEWQEKQGQLADLLAPVSGAAGGEQGARVHLIGPLQSNKTNRATELFHGIDAVDSLKIAARLDSAARTLGRRLPVLLEVKLSHEASKHGLAPGELEGVLQECMGLANVVVTGLMTVPPWSEDAEQARPYFRELRRLRDRYRPGFPALTELSMGMSNDFVVGIEEGSTCVRVGTALFGRREYPVAGANL